MYNENGDSMKIRNTWLMIENKKQQTVQEFLDFYKINKKKKNQLLKEDILVNKQKVTLDTLLMVNDVIALNVFKEEPYGCKVSKTVCNVLYEDEFVLIVNKPSGIIIHDDGASDEDTLDYQVAAYYQKNGIQRAVLHIHRLDKETSGCVMYCKCSFFQPFLDALLKEKNIQRTYIALAEGVIEWDKKRLDYPIGKDRHHNRRQRVSKTGKNAITDVSVLKRNNKKKISMVECRLKTGRTHQIRVHMQAVGHPLLSDELYGKRSHLIHRCALHGYQMKWIDPVLFEEKWVECAIPDEILKAIY